MNDNLLFHGCVPLTENGEMVEMNFFGQFHRGRSYFDCCERVARQAFLGRKQRHLDYMWYLWGGIKSPMCGRVLKTFERTYIDDKSSWKEPQDPYYAHLNSEAMARMILRDFVIDGGFSTPYHKTTGIAGYTLIYNSHGMRLKSHEPFESVEKVIDENLDIESRATQFEMEPYRVMIGDTDKGKEIANQIDDLKELLEAYRDGSIAEGVQK